MPNEEADPIVKYYCTKLTPWNHVPPQIGKETIIHNDAKEVYEDCDCSLVDYKCPNCGHTFTLDLS